MTTWGRTLSIGVAARLWAAVEGEGTSSTRLTRTLYALWAGNMNSPHPLSKGP